MIVRDVMTRDVACVQADASIEAAIAMMLERRISGLPVLDREGSIIGIVTEGDLLRRPELGTAPPKPAGSSSSSMRTVSRKPMRGNTGVASPT